MDEDDAPGEEPPNVGRAPLSGGHAADSAGKRRLEAGQEPIKDRADRALSDAWPDLSRSRLKALIEGGHLTLDGEPMTDPSAKLRPGGAYELTVPAPAPAAPRPEDIPLTVLFEDAHLIVIDKRAGMAVHPAVGNWSGTLVHALLSHCKGSLSGIGGVERPGIVHRLDKDTSGVMVAAKSDQAHQGLAAQFASHALERGYLALCRAAPNPRSGRIETKIARSDKDRKKQAVLALDASRGKRAATLYKTLKTYGQIPGQPVGSPAASLIECALETGRTHQVRVHLAHLGAPLLGDPLYGKQRAWKRIQTAEGEELQDFSRQALHAAVLGFTHPVTGERLRFETPMPKDMQRLAKFLERL